jgi:MOSC domain-containing protein YiiM
MQVVSVHASPGHGFSKASQASITLLAGLGVAGDAHAGVTVQHRSRVAKDPTQPNLRQVHLLHTELLDELVGRGFKVAPGAMGENIGTRGLDLLALPQGTELRIGAQALLRITGLRNPCAQLDAYQSGLMAAVLGRASDGSLQRKAGVMAVVLRGGLVAPGDALSVALPAPPHRALVPV